METYRKEIKYIVSNQIAAQIACDLSKILQTDVNSGNSGELEGYTVRSLYFDTPYNADYGEKLAGVFERKKVRLRIYNYSDAVCKIELKQKKGDNQHKESLLISSKDANSLMNKDYECLKKYFEESPFALRLYALLLNNCYAPVTIIDYKRKAYSYPLYDIRVTLDSDIRYREQNLDIFDTDSYMFPQMYENTVLEIKYSGKMIAFISDIIKKYNVTQSSYSKYTGGRKSY